MTGSNEDNAPATGVDKEKKPSRNRGQNAMGKTKGKPNPVDEHVGNRLRMRRSLLGFSQEKLAAAIGLTFQQVQKYERGTNRISASRLYQFSKVLNIPVSYFFESYEESAKPQYGLSDTGQERFLLDEDVLHDKESLELLRLYYSISDTKVRKDMLKILKTMVGNMKDDR